MYKTLSHSRVSNCIVVFHGTFYELVIFHAFGITQSLVKIKQTIIFLFLKNLSISETS